MRWFGTKFAEGFFVLLPFLIAYLMLGQMFDGLLALTQPVVDFLPIDLFDSEVLEVVFSVFEIVNDLEDVPAGIATDRSAELLLVIFNTEHTQVDTQPLDRPIEHVWIRLID